MGGGNVKVRQATDGSIPNAAQKRWSLPERKLRQEHRPKHTMFNIDCFLIYSIRLISLNVKLATDLPVLTICLTQWFPKCVQSIATDREELSGVP